MKLASILVILLTAPAAFAITAAEQSIRDISAVVSHGQSLPDENQSCDKRPEEYRIRTAAIFDSNDLGVMTELGIPNQCFSSSPTDEPSTGKFIGFDHEGRELSLGSGDTVASSSVVVTNAHSLLYGPRRDENGNPISGDREPIPTNQIVFRVFEGTPSNCRQVDYPVQGVSYGTLDPAGDKSNDFAVVKLRRPVTSYKPLELASEELVERTFEGREEILMVGFSSDASTNNGENYSASICRASRPPIGNFYQNNANFFIHDCDTAPGGSGSAATVVKPASGFSNTGMRSRYDRYFVGLHQGHRAYEMPEDPNEPQSFDQYRNFNLGIVLNPRLRQMIEDAARERVASAE